jgi:hypothetical protein
MVDNPGIAHNQAGASAIQLGKAVIGEKSHAGFVD